MSKNALMMSGGLDSTVLMFKLLSEGISFTALCVNKNKNEKWARPIVSFLEKKFDVHIESLYDVDNTNQQSREKAIEARINSGLSPEVAMRTYEGSVIPAVTDTLKNYDLVYMATTKNPPVDVGGLAPFRPKTSIHPKLQLPFIDMNKLDVINCGIELGVPIELFKMTHSCTESLEICGQCFACKERAWAIQLSSLKGLVV